MTCANFQFKHNQSCHCCGEFTIDTPSIVVNQQSVISITMRSASTFAAYGTVVLYWSQVVPDPNNPGCYLLSNVGVATEICGPDVGGTIQPQQITGLGYAKFTYPWLPDSSITSSPQCPYQIALFAQAYAIADPSRTSPSYCPSGQWFKTDFSVASVYNAAQVFSFSS